MASPRTQALAEPSDARRRTRPREYWRNRVLALVAEECAESAARGIEKLREGGIGLWETVDVAERVQGLAMRALLAVEARRIPKYDTSVIVELCERSDPKRTVLSLEKVAKLREILDLSAAASESKLDPEAQEKPSARANLIGYILGVGGDFRAESSPRGSLLYDSQPKSSPRSAHISTLSRPPLPVAHVEVSRTKTPERTQPRLGVWRLPVRIENRLRVADRIVREVAKGRGATEPVVTAAKLMDMLNPFSELLRRQVEPKSAEFILTSRTEKPLDPVRMVPDEARWHFGRTPPDRVVHLLLAPLSMTKQRRRESELEQRLLKYRPGIQQAKTDLGGCVLYHPQSKIQVAVRPVRSRQGVGGPRGWVKNRMLAEEIMLRELETRDGVKNPWKVGSRHGGCTVEAR